MLIDFLFPKRCLECGLSGSYICKNCLEKVRKGQKTNTNITLFRYEGVIRKAIIALKYKYATEITRELADVCCKRLRDLGFEGNTTLVPIPLHKTRLRKRGFNQTEKVGLLLAQNMGWEFAPNVLVRKKASTPQVGLKKTQREINVKRVFGIGQVIKNNNHILVVFDDVYTTGATLAEARHTLKEKGYNQILSLVIAK